MLRFIILSVFFFAVENNLNSTEIKIITKVENEIITNLDIINETKYLLLLNKELKKVTKSEIYDIANNSFINEKIKLIEIKRVFKNYENIILDDNIYNDYIIKIGFNNKSEFSNFLNKINLSEDFVKKKIITERLWNKIIFERFGKNIKVDEKKIKENIEEYVKNLEKNYEYNISEILIDKDISILNKVKLSIKSSGFEATANKYSNADTSKFGGRIGWVKDIMMAKEINNIISKLKLNQTTNPIELQNGYLILKVNSKREIQKQFDIEVEIKNQIIRERNKQLNQFSNIYFKKIKQNMEINEYR